jgi:beta-glucosidase-like glycosyl hydrolase
VGGFILFGGEAASVRELTAEIRARAGQRLLIASDLERGAGQQFAGATPLPPAAALGSLGDPEVTRRAGALTAREARALGVDWVFAPVADLDLEPRNPIIGTRAFGADSALAALQVAAWVRGCREGGGLACAKHFPGHGRTLADSHAALPTVTADAATLEMDLAPFRAAVEAGVDSLMIGHVAFPALDRGGVPATRSPAILQGLLRERLGFRGLAVTDAVDMAGFAGRAETGARVVDAVAAGCDAVLGPLDVEEVAGWMRRRLDRGGAFAGRVRLAIGRVEAAAARVEAGAPPGPAQTPGWGSQADGEWARGVAERTVRPLRGDPRLPPDSVDPVVVDDDIGGPHPVPDRSALSRALRGSGVRIEAGGHPLIAVFSDPRAWKGRAGLSPAARQAVREACVARPDAITVLFGHPRIAEEIPFARHVLLAWGGEPLMQEAAARVLARPGGAVARPG